jgi:hypothetical protein
METLKNITSFLYYFILVFTMVLGSMMEYFGNSYGKFFLIPAILIGCYEIHKNDK